MPVNKIYPLTIIRDRYNGAYSGGKYLAFNLNLNEIPLEIEGNDSDCMNFFYDNKLIIGKGHTIEEAVNDLIEKLEGKDGNNN